MPLRFTMRREGARLQVETYAQGLKVEHPFARCRSLDGVEDMLRVFDVFKFDQSIILALGNQNFLPAILAEAQDKQALLDVLNTDFRVALSCAVHVDLLRRFGVPRHCLCGKEGGGNQHISCKHRMSESTWSCSPCKIYCKK